MTTHYAKTKPLKHKSGGRASRCREHGGTTKLAPGAPARRRGHWRCERRATANAPREEATAPTTTRREREPLMTTHYAKTKPLQHKSGGRASRCRERGGTTKPAPGAPTRRRRPWRHERRATATASREEATARTSTGRKHEPLSTAHRAAKASRRHERAAIERHADASAAARQSRRQERQRGAAGRGAVSAVRRRSPPEEKRPRQRPHAESASR